VSAPVVVVGGGPAGAMLAYLLASRGVATTLVERQSDFAREFRGEGLSPGGQSMFREAGLRDDFDALPHTRFDRAGLYFRGRRFASLDLSRLGDFAPRWVSQPAMLEMLVERSSQFANFTFLRGVPVAGARTENGRVTGIALAGSGDLLAADYVFACDGRLSSLRRDAGLDQPRNPESFDVVWCKLPMPDFYAHGAAEVRGYIGNRQLGLFIPSHDELLQVGWVIPKGSYRELRDQGVEHWLEQIENHVSADMAAHLRRYADATLRPFLLDVVCDCFDHWSVPGMTLLGDAAHPMSPVGAQGINIALRDAVVAANHFVPLLLDGAEASVLDAAAAAFRAERIAEVAPIQKMQRRGPRLLFGNDLLLAGVVGIVGGLQRLGLLGLLTRRFDFGPRAFAFGVTEVKLEV
jgi:2-polyprenyl-6-methoxyphenol hydroxylase-like FAD-dependent oxidoreductase